MNHRSRVEPFYKDRYDFELQRKEQLTNALGLPVATLSILAGAIIAMANSFTYEHGPLSLAFGGVVLVDLVAFVVCLVYLGLAYHRQDTVYLPKLRDWEDWEQEYSEWKSYVRGTGGEEIEPEPTLQDRVIDAADKNTQANDARSGLLYWARVWMFGVLILTAFAAVPYMLDQGRVRNGRTAQTPATAPAADSTPEPASSATQPSNP
jgi:hypothetical protein